MFMHLYILVLPKPKGKRKEDRSVYEVVPVTSGSKDSGTITDEDNRSICDKVNDIACDENKKNEGKLIFCSF